LNIFDKANGYIRDTEASVVNLLSAIAPWGAPLAPAFMSYGGMVNTLNFPVWVALIIAGVIEILGLATVHTTIVFWQHNRRYKADMRKMPTALAGSMFGLYLVVILTVNVLMEAFISWPGMPIVARALLSLLTVPAAITMVIRTQHTELLHEIRGKSAGKLSESSSGKKTERKVSENLPQLTDWRSLPAEDRLLIRSLNTAQIVQQYGVSERTARNWRASSNNGKQEVRE
jgi:hypothetical protein